MRKKGKRSKKFKAKKRKNALSSPEFSEFDQLLPGMPARDSIQEVREFVSPKNVRYTILRTNEMDAYDPPPSKKKKRKSKS